MYFREEDVRDVLGGIAPLLGNPRSRLWADFVNEQAIVNSNVFPEVEAFMQSMRLLGEPFVFGSDSLEDFMKSNGFACLQIAPSSLYFPETKDPVYSVYSFCVSSEAIVPAVLEERSEQEQTIPRPHAPSQFVRQ